MKDHKALFKTINEEHNCPFCGLIIKNHYNYCPHCGKKQ